MMESIDEIATLKMQCAILEARIMAVTERLSAEEGGGGMGREDAPVRALEGTSGRAFEYGFDGTECKLFNCVFMFGRRVYKLQDQSVDGDGRYMLKIPHDNPNNATVTSQEEANTQDVTYIPLLVVAKGRITADYRGMPCIPAYE